MKQPDEAWWERARRARDQLAAQLLGRSDVSMIDIGLDPERRSETPVLRIHLRGSAPSVLGVEQEEERDGIPIRFVRGDYRLQDGSSAAGEKEVNL
jgi:hypothetical protein